MYLLVSDGTVYVLILFEECNWKLVDYANGNQISVCVIQQGELQEDLQFLSSVLASKNVLKSIDQSILEVSVNGQRLLPQNHGTTKRSPSSFSSPNLFSIRESTSFSHMVGLQPSSEIHLKCQVNFPYSSKE